MQWLQRVREIVERVANSEGLELVDVEYAGRAPRAVLRIILDKPGGTAISDCQNVSQQVGTLLDVENLMPGSYTLEVSSPGLDRKLLKPSDFQRFAGKQVNLVLKSPRQGARRFRGRLLGMSGEKVALEVGAGQRLEFEYPEIEKANLVVEFAHPAKPGKAFRGH